MRYASQLAIIATLLLALASPRGALAQDEAAAETEEAAATQETTDETSGDESDEADEDGEAYAVVTPDQVSGWLAASEAIAADANGADTRAEFGILPGAILLSGGDFDVEGELPDDKSKKLVFYCGSPQCQAAPAAAQRAIDAGYEDVTVMAAGIRGWVDAGLATEQPSN